MSNIPIYVINLKRTPERKLYIQRQLDSFGLEYQWIEAIDAQNFKDSELAGVDLNDNYQPGAMACLLSHAEFYNRMIQNNHSIACVLEDDAQLLPSFPDILNYENLAKEDWEILLLCHHSNITFELLFKYYRYAKVRTRFVLWDATCLGATVENFPKKCIKDHYIATPCKYSQGLMPKTTTAYLVKLPAAEKMRDIAFANQKSIYADDITGCAYAFGISLRVMTPPCVTPSIIYLKNSLVMRGGYGCDQVDIKTDELPDENLLRLYVRNRWKAIASSVFPFRIRLVVCFLETLIRLSRSKMVKYLKPRSKYSGRVQQAIKKFTNPK